MFTESRHTRSIAESLITAAIIYAESAMDTADDIEYATPRAGAATHTLATRRYD